MAGRSKRYKFEKKEYAKGGVLSFAVACVSLALILLCVGAAYFSGGKTDTFYGAAGVVSLLLAVFAFGTGMRSLAQQKGSLLFSVLGAITGGVVMVLWLTLILAGMR